MSNLPRSTLPIHKLTTTQAKYWFMGEDYKRTFATNLVRQRYRGGVAICSPTLWMFAMISPNGAVRELQPPFKGVLLSEIANAPGRPGHIHDLSECQCAAFYDPESRGPWKARGDKRSKEKHHPLCQFALTSMVVYEHFANKVSINPDTIDIPGVRGVEFDGPGTICARPDAWIRKEEEILAT
jgi:hypothetical protein